MIPSLVINMLTSVAWVAIFLSVAFASPVSRRDDNLFDTFASVTPSTSLQWQSCDVGFFCAILEVPLDYNIPSGPKAYVPIIKYPASTGPYNGMIFINPGGPGASAVLDFLVSAPIFAPLVGTNYDLVTYDPRGIGFSSPAASCGTPNSEQRIRKRLFNQPYGPRLPFKFYQDEYTYQQALGSSCASTIGGMDQAGQHMSTANVARDAVSILDAFAASNYSAGLQNAKDFNFWGFSYGTIVGQTFAMLFPDRVGRFVLDGVNDAEDYYSGLGLKNIYLSDRAFATFFAYCNKAGSGCSFNTGTTSKDIFDRFERMVLQLDVKKAFQENWSNKTAIYIGLQGLKLILRSANSYPNFFFPTFADQLVFLESKTQSGLTVQHIQDIEAAIGYKLNLHPFEAFTQWPPAVACPDTGNKDLGKSLQQLQPITDELERQSWVAGELWAAQRIACTTWSIPAKGRYIGKFGGHTKTPILFVSNTRDPVTPLPNGIKAALIFKKAKLLAIDGTGIYVNGFEQHTTNGPLNKCAYEKIKNYFQTGIASNSFCPLEQGPFGVTLSGLVLKRSEDEIVPRIAALAARLRGDNSG